MLAKSKCQRGECLASLFTQRYEGFPELFGLDDSAQLDEVLVSSTLRSVESRGECERYRGFEASTPDTRLEAALVSHSKGRRRRAFRCSTRRLPS